MTVTFDSSAWIEYFSGSDLGLIVKKYVDSTETINTPSIGLLEIKNKYQRENKKWKRRIDFICERSAIIDLNSQIALLGADMKNQSENLEFPSHFSHPTVEIPIRDMKKESGLYSIDAIIYASARAMKSELLTKDKHFQGLKNVIMLK